MAGPREICGSTSSACGARWTSSSATPFARAVAAPSRRQRGFSPRVDVYYCGDEPPRGRQGRAGRGRHRRGLARGRRPRAGDHRRAPGRARPRAASTSRSRSRPAPFRRVVELGADVVAERARATLRRRHPAGRAAARRARSPPRPDRAARPMADESTATASRSSRRPTSSEAIRGRATGPLPAALPVLPLQGDGRLPGHADPARGRPGALDQADRRRALRRAHARPGRLARPRARGARARAALRGRRRRRRRADAQGPRRHDADPGPGDRAGPDRRLRHRGAVPGRADRGAARRGRRSRPSSRR